MFYIKHLEDNLVDIIKIFILTFILIIINLVIVLRCTKGYIKDNWTKYRCNPLIVPFASFFNENAFDNFGQCLFSQTAGYMSIFLQPIHQMIEIITTIFTSFKDSIQEIRKVILKIRIFFQWVVKDVMQRIQDVAGTMQFFFAKLKSIFGKSYAIFVTISYTMFTAYQSFLSIWNGPIGWTARTLCFDSETNILMSNGSKKKIKDIKINDNLYLSGKVIGLLKFKNKNTKMYYYNNVIVSGSHLVKENNKWIRVIDSKNSIYIESYNKKYIYCLITTNNNIIVSNSNNFIEFSDFIETNSNVNNCLIKKIILSDLNKNFFINPFDINTSNNNYYLTGFGGNTLLKLKNGSIKKLKHIKIGDKLQTGRVIGKIKQKIININDVCIIKTKKQNIITSKNQILYYNNRWLEVKNLNNIKDVSQNCENLYNLCIDKNIIKIDGIVFRDYLENNNLKLNNFIDNCISIKK